MKKGLWIFLLVFLCTGCLGIGEKEDSARARVAVKNAKSVIDSIKLDYTLDKSSIPVGTKQDILTIPKADMKVESGTFTILSDTADSDISQIRLDGVVIDGHSCSGTKEDMKCTILP